MAPSWPLNSAKLPLEQRFGRPNGVKLAPEWRFGPGTLGAGPASSERSDGNFVYTRVLPSIYIDEGVFSHCKLVAVAKVLDSS